MPIQAPLTQQKDPMAEARARQEQAMAQNQPPQPAAYDPSKAVQSGPHAISRTREVSADPAAKQPVDNSETILEWDTTEFIKHDKNKNWFIYGSLVAAGFIAYALLTQAWLFAVVIVLLVIVVYYFAVKEPEKLKTTVTEKGVHFHDQYYPFNTIGTFWIIYLPGENTTLNFRTGGFFSLPVTIQLADQDPNEIRELFIRKEVDEDLNKEESVSERMARRLKF